jgi:branched-subunit amino acid transport protein
MIEGIWLWIAFVLLGATTLITRGSFIVIGERGTLPPVLQRALRYAPAAALSALVVPDLLLVQGNLQPFNPKLLAGLVVIVIALRWRNPWLPFILGMGALWGARFFAGLA